MNCSSLFSMSSLTLNQKLHLSFLSHPSHFFSPPWEDEGISPVWEDEGFFYPCSVMSSTYYLPSPSLLYLSGSFLSYSHYCLHNFSSCKKNYILSTPNIILSIIKLFESIVHCFLHLLTPTFYPSIHCNLVLLFLQLLSKNSWPSYCQI